ncbi:MAG: hypothetical protein ACRD3J_03025 [Thermoanaerobaculia bacterium]
MIYDVSGRVVKRFDRDVLGAGRHRLLWDAVIGHAKVPTCGH